MELELEPGSGPPVQTIGTSTGKLIEPCPNDGEAPPEDVSDESFALSFSGGGWRAALTTAGTLRFVADAGLLSRVHWVSSVSGGSITNGLFAKHYEKLREADFNPAVVDELILKNLLAGARESSLARTLIANAWKALGPKDQDADPRRQP